MQITFDTTTDTIEKVLAVTHAAFGVHGALIQGALVDTTANDAIGETRTIDPADDPSAGTDTTQKDKDGLPWDARVHSTPPSMTTAGVWRAKRGRKDEDYAAVKAEYAPAPAPGPVAAAPAPAPTAPPPMPAMAAPAPVVPAVKTAYQELSEFLQTHIAAGTNGCNADWVRDSLANMGVQDGNVLNAQGLPDDALDGMLGQFKVALGIA